ncbi:hypothetical protein C1645_874073 [Glomus cerebriforme]|uniref:Uncharacterized protein n=1 Tax=Glomus cerebriforme TaxID=658196 RepID=A0A397T5B7_9GLOM|nr:hypothetical protein C1645_874073 [Glomus cerebriforme]
MNKCSNTLKIVANSITGVGALSIIKGTLDCMNSTKKGNICPIIGPPTINKEIVNLSLSTIDKNKLKDRIETIKKWNNKLRNIRMRYSIIAIIYSIVLIITIFTTLFSDNNSMIVLDIELIFFGMIGLIHCLVKYQFLLNLEFNTKFSFVIYRIFACVPICAADEEGKNLFLCKFCCVPRITFINAEKERIERILYGLDHKEIHC